MEKNQPITADLLTDKSTTRGVYASMLKSWRKFLNTDMITLNVLNENFDEFKKSIEEKTDKNSSRKNHFSLLMKISKDNDMELYKMAEHEFNKYKNLVLGIQETNQLKENEVVLTAEELEERINELKKKLPDTYNNIKDYRKLMLYLSVLFLQSYPIRNDLAESKIFYLSNFSKLKDVEKDINKSIEDDVNFIFINDKKRSSALLKSYFRNSQYKTVSTYGANEFFLTGKVEQEFKAYNKIISKFAINNVWLINEDNTPMTRSGFSMFLRRRDFSSTSIRKTAVSSLLNPEKNQLKKQKDLAQIMSHSLGTQQTYYSKVLTK